MLPIVHRRIIRRSGKTTLPAMPSMIGPHFGGEVGGGDGGADEVRRVAPRRLGDDLLRNDRDAGGIGDDQADRLSPVGLPSRTRSTDEYFEVGRRPPQGLRGECLHIVDGVVAGEQVSATGRPLKVIRGTFGSVGDAPFGVNCAALCASARPTRSGSGGSLSCRRS